MATLILETLEAAFDASELDGRESHDSSQVEKMNWLLSLIWERPGISSVELRRETGLAHSTVLTYCRWLYHKGLINAVHKGQGGVSHYSPP